MGCWLYRRICRDPRVSHGSRLDHVPVGTSGGLCALGPGTLNSRQSASHDPSGLSPLPVRPRVEGFYS
jgi:hypothetical protein